MHTKRKIVFLLILVLILGLVGCEIVDSDGNPISQPTRPTANDWDELELDPELRQAIEGRSSGILWRIPAEFQPEGTVSVHSYAALDCAVLWPELQSAVFPEANKSAETQKDGIVVRNIPTESKAFPFRSTPARCNSKGSRRNAPRLSWKKSAIFWNRSWTLSCANGPARSRSTNG